jgi:proline dehydrogenase
MFLYLRSLTLSPICRGAALRQYHHLHNAQPPRLPRLGARVVLVTGVATATAFAFSTLGASDVYADTSDFANVEDFTIRSVQLTSLLRSYFVFSVCSVPRFVDWSPHIISFMSSVPGLKQLVGVLVRRSFFAQVRIYLGHYRR